MILRNKMAIKFGTDGWRGIIADDFTFDHLRQVAQAHATVLKAKGGRKIAIGYDTRFLAAEFAQAVAEVFASNGFEVVLAANFCPTPALSLMVKKLKADAGVMITASHNPYCYHGYKVKTHFGGPADSSLIKAIEARLGQEKVKRGVKSWQEEDFNQAYLQELKNYFSPQIFQKHSFTIVHDAMFGASQGLLKQILTPSSLKVIEINQQRDAFFGFHSPEPIEKNLTSLKKAVIAHKAHLGLAQDGDGDRLGLVDHLGQFINPQLTYVLLLLATLRQRKVKGAIVKTVSVSYLVDRIAQKEKRKLYQTSVGFKHTAPLFLKEKIAFAGEESGGYSFGFHLPERDGLLAGLILLELVVLSQKTLPELIEAVFREFGPAYYLRQDLHLTPEQAQALIAQLKKESLKEIAGFRIKKREILDGVKFVFQNDGWLLFRASGTEPLLRIYAEMPSQEAVQKVLEAGKLLEQNQGTWKRSSYSDQAKRRAG